MENKKPCIRVQVRVLEDDHPELYDYLSQIEPYYRARRILKLASRTLELGIHPEDSPKGASIEKNNAGNANGASKVKHGKKKSSMPSNTTVSSTPAISKGYTIPDSAADAIGDMLEALDSK